MKKKWISRALLTVLAMAPGVVFALTSVVEDVNNTASNAGQYADGQVTAANNSLFGVIDSFAAPLGGSKAGDGEGNGAGGSGSAAQLSTAPPGGAKTLLAGGRIGVNKYTVTCDSSKSSESVANSVAKTEYRPSLASNICGLNGLSSMDFGKLLSFNPEEYLQKAFCSGVKMIADPVTDKVNGYISQSDSLASGGVGYLNGLNKAVEENATNSDNWMSDGSSGSGSNSLAPNNQNPAAPAGKSYVPKDYAAELGWDDSAARSINLNGEDVVSVKFTVPELAPGGSPMISTGNFNVGGTGKHDVLLSSRPNSMVALNQNCLLSSSLSATLRFTTGTTQYGRCQLTPGGTYYLNVRQVASEGNAIIKLFHN